MYLSTAVNNMFFSEKLFNSLNYLETLIESDCINQANDWKTNFFVFEKESCLVVNDFQLIKNIYINQPEKVILPAYIRFQSNDDFSHDHHLIDVYERLSHKKYYPKLQICTPYMPIEGSNFLNTTLHEFKKHCIQKVMQWASQNNINSVHYSLPDKSEYEILSELKFFNTEKQIGYWKNKNYHSFDDFLLHLKSKYRAQIKKERQKQLDCAYESFFVQGDRIEINHIHTFFKLFQYTHQRKGWIMSKLSKAFFVNLWNKCSKNMILFFIKQENEVIASSCAFLHGDMLCGRFWGSLNDKNYIHFEIMYYLLIEYAISNKIPSIEIGFSNLHKTIRGFDTVQAKNFHYIFNFNENLFDKMIFSQTGQFKTVYK